MRVCTVCAAFVGVIILSLMRRNNYRCNLVFWYCKYNRYIITHHNRFLRFIDVLDLKRAASDFTRSSIHSLITFARVYRSIAASMLVRMLHSALSSTFLSARMEFNGRNISSRTFRLPGLRKRTQRLKQTWRLHCAVAHILHFAAYEFFCILVSCREITRK